MKVGKGRVFVADDVSERLQAAANSAGEHDGEVFLLVAVPVLHAGAVKHSRVVEETFSTK